MTDGHPSRKWRSYLRDDPRRPAPGERPEAADPEAFEALMRHERFPRASAYDPVWVRQNLMGPNALWLVDDLSSRLGLEPGMRVLDLGCGSAITSIFLAREYGVRVHAADLWIEPTANLERIVEAEVDHLVVPIEAEAHQLPFAHAYFDVIVSVDSYHYFGTDVRYLSYLAQFLKPGGVAAITVPGNAHDPDDPDPSAGDGASEEEARARHGADWFTFRSADWWRRHWGRTSGIVVEHAAMLEDGWDVWHRHEQAGAAWSGKALEERGDGALLLTEAGRSLGFARVVARRTEGATLMFGPGRYSTRIA